MKGCATAFMSLGVLRDDCKEEGCGFIRGSKSMILDRESFFDDILMRVRFGLIFVK